MAGLNQDREVRRAAPKRVTPAQIINHLRKADVELANGKPITEVCRGIGVSEQIYYRWRKEYGGMQVNQAKRMKELEGENQHLRRAVANLTADNLILQENLLSPEGIRQRYYSMSAQIREERKDYYWTLEWAQEGWLDVTRWQTWFLNCLPARHRRGSEHAVLRAREGGTLLGTLRHGAPK